MPGYSHSAGCVTDHAGTPCSSSLPASRKGHSAGSLLQEVIKSKQNKDVTFSCPEAQAVSQLLLLLPSYLAIALCQIENCQLLSHQGPSPGHPVLPWLLCPVVLWLLLQCQPCRAVGKAAECGLDTHTHSRRSSERAPCNTCFYI